MTIQYHPELVQQPVKGAEIAYNALSEALGDKVKFEPVNSYWALRGEYKGLSFFVDFSSQKYEVRFSEGALFKCSPKKRPALIKSQFEKEFSIAKPLHVAKVAKENQDKMDADKKKEMEKSFIREFPEFCDEPGYREGIYCCGKLGELRLNKNGTEVSEMEIRWIKPSTAKKILEILKDEVEA